MAVDAEQVLLGSAPAAGALAVDAHPPVAELVTMALAAQLVGLGEQHLVPAGEVQVVAAIGIVAVQAPAALGAVLELDLVMHGQVAPLGIDLQLLTVVAARAGKDPLGEGWLRHLEAILGSQFSLGAGRIRQSGHCQEKQAKAYGTDRVGVDESTSD